MIPVVLRFPIWRTWDQKHKQSCELNILTGSWSLFSGQVGKTRTPPHKSIQITVQITLHRADALRLLASAAEANISGSTCMPSRQTDRSPTTSVWSLSALSCRVCTTSETDIQERRVERYGMHATHTCAHTQACKHAHTYTQACKHVHAHASL